MSTSSIKRHIRGFHVVVVQWTSKKLKSVMHVVVDKVVVVVLKFPTIVLWTTLCRSTMKYLKISQTNQSAAGNNKRNNCSKRKRYTNKKK